MSTGNVAAKLLFLCRPVFSASRHAAQASAGNRTIIPSRLFLLVIPFAGYSSADQLIMGTERVADGNGREWKRSTSNGEWKSSWRMDEKIEEEKKS